MPKEISAYDFVQTIKRLNPNNFIERLLEHTRKSETYYLELKAGIEVPNEDLNPGESPQDIFWNIAHEIIAMINTRGGILIIGISDEKDHHVVPLENNDRRKIIENEGVEAYIRTAIKDKVLPPSKRWKYKGLTLSIDADINQYVEIKSVDYAGHTICAFLVRPCAESEVILVRKTHRDGNFVTETCPTRNLGDIGQCDDIEGFMKIQKYIQHRKITSSQLAADAERFEKEFQAQIKTDFNDAIETYTGQTRRDHILELIKHLLGEEDLSTATKARGETTTTPVSLDTTGEAAKDKTSSLVAQSYKTAFLEEPSSRRQTLSQLKNRTFDAVCIKSLGSVGFLQHPDFENGIFVHVSTTNNTLLSEGQKWRVKVGARFNEKHRVWCYAATSATLLQESERMKFPYALLANEVSRRETITNLHGKIFDAYCKVGNGTYGYLYHPDFEGQIYIDIPVTNGIKIHEGQKWRFEVGAHCLPPNGLWIYRARKATLIEESAKYTLEDIATPESREKTMNRLQGIVFTAKCSDGRGTCGLLQHPDFEGGIYIDEPVTNHIQIHTGQTWQFEIWQHQMGPKGPWVYRARKAILIEAPDTPPPPNPRKRYYTLAEIATLQQRESVEKELDGLEFEATCIKSLDTFGFLGNVPFEQNLFIHQAVTNGTPIIEGQKWLVKVGTLLNNKKAKWCYCVKSGHLLNIPHNNNDSNDICGKGINTSDLAIELKSQNISIYIDETWPGTQNPTYKDIGVIGGVAVPWVGTDEKRLPLLRTHLNNGKESRDAIQCLLAKPEVFPFVFPIKWDQTVGAGGSIYFELVQHALMLLLGWILPQRNQPTTVDIYLEHISGFMDGHDETDFIMSLTQAMRLFSGSRRFSNWNIRKVKWVDKNFEYVPYGDLVCKTCVPLKEQQLLAEKVKVREWEGFLPFSKNVFPLLRDMDTASPSGLADLLVSFAKVASDTPLFRRIRKMAIERAKSDPTFRDAIFSRFEECYAQPERDIALLNRVVPHFLKEFPPDTFKSTPRTQLLRILIGFQHANHNGDPDLANALADDYRSLRPRMINLDRDLCAYADLNLAVHLHDSFDFSSALALAKAWIDDPLFPALSIVNQGRMFSSYGQSLALLGRFLEADEAFTKALVQFMSEPELLAKDIEQTTTYRAINLLDINSRSAIPLIESLLKGSILSSVSELDTVLARPFIAHLLLKALWRMRIDLPNERDAFLKHLPKKISVKDQHPYELVLFYLALLTKETVPSYANAQVIKMEEVFAQMEFGGTLGLIHAFLRVMLKRHGLNTITEKEFLDELNIVAQYLPNASTIITTLQSAWTDSTIPIDDILPFNYC